MTVPGCSNPLLMYGNAGAYQISRSLRFNASDSAYLSRTPGSAGDRRKFTFAAWVKIASLTAGQNVLFSVTDGTTPFAISWQSDGAIIFGSLSFAWKETTAKLRDYSAWYHICVSVDTDQGSNANRLKFYVNGTQQTDFSTNRDLYLNTNLAVNGTFAHEIGRYSAGSNQYFNGYLADVFFINGQQLDPSSFTETDATTGQLIPKAYTGSYGTNGFHLDFADNSAATATTLGKDTSGNGNNWTPNNFSVAANFNTSQNWSSLLSASGGSGFANQGAGGFAGYDDVNNYTYVNGASSGTNYTITLTPPSPISFTTSLVVRVESGVSQVTINGGATWVSDTGGLVTFTGPGSFSAITVRDSRGQYSGEFHSVRVDGVLLANPGALSQNDSLVDVPTSSGTDLGVGGEVRGNYCTLNPLKVLGGYTLANGNLDISGSAKFDVASTFAVSTGKWYWEIAITTVGDPYHGIMNANNYWSTPGTWGSGPFYLYTKSNILYTAAGFASYGASYTNGDMIGVGLNLDTNQITFYKNGVSQGAVSITAGTYTPLLYSDSGSYAFSINFGQRAFAYTAPSGFKALCTANLPAPVVTKPSTVMDVKLYTGNGSTQTISGLGFSPDLVWIKRRDTAQDHNLYDSVRGSSGGYIKQLYSNLTSAESTYGDGVYGGVTALNSDGFSLGSSNSDYRLTNASSSPYAAWTWDAGSSTVTNTQGSITSSVRANATAGFSVVTYTGTGANATVGHGLGVAPGFIIIKNRSSATNWRVYHSALGNTKVIFLSTTGTSDTNSVYWNNTSPTSTVFSVGSDDGVNGNTNSMVAYCFAPVAGYSSFGSYTGNGSSDGPFVYTGFRPRWVMYKRSDSTSDWWIYDAARSTYNVASKILYPNASSAEDDSPTYHSYDMLSNGFKVRMGISPTNVNGATYVYAAFSETAFNFARAR